LEHRRIITDYFGLKVCIQIEHDPSVCSIICGVNKIDYGVCTRDESLLQKQAKMQYKIISTGRSARMIISRTIYQIRNAYIKMYIVRTAISAGLGLLVARATTPNIMIKKLRNFPPLS
jgi:hypothetical protein